jgi:hypothetical protein
VSFGTAGCSQPSTGSQTSFVQGLPSSQLGGVPGAQTPAWQVSIPLQTVPSSHDVPFGTAACWQPVVVLHVSVVHGLPSSQLGGVPAVHTVPEHVSSPLHALPSEHGVPFTTAVF